MHSAPFSRLGTAQTLALKHQHPYQKESLGEGADVVQDAAQGLLSCTTTSTATLEERIDSLKRDSLNSNLLSVASFISILHDSRKAKNDEFVMRSLMYLQTNGLEAQSFAQNLFLTTFADLGDMGYAQRVFNRSHCRNESSWRNLISGYVKNGKPREALGLYEEMWLDQSVYPSKYTFVAALTACSQLADLERGCRIHDQIDKNGLIEKDVVVGSALVHMYAQCGILAKARAVFDKLSMRDGISWNVLLTGYAKHGHSMETLKCYEEMKLEGVTADPVTLLCCLKACGNLGSLGRGEALHAEIKKSGFLETNVAVGNALVDMYAKCGDLIKAQEVFNKLLIRDVVSWTALISGYVEAGNGQAALNCFRCMHSDRISLDPILIVCVLKACGSVGEVNMGQELHMEIVTKGFERNMHVCSSLIDMYSKFAYLSTSKKMFDSLSVRGLVSWNALIAGYVKFGYADEALNCFDQMQHEGIDPDAITYACSLTACGFSGAADKGKEIHEIILKQGCLLERDRSVANALIDMYAKCGLFTRTRDVFDNLLYRDVVSWTTLISGYADQGYCEEALNCYTEMQLEGISPDASTFICCLKACGDAGARNMGEEIHSKIARQGLPENDNVVGNALLDMYAKCGVLAKARDMFNQLAARDVVACNALIGGCVQHQSCEEALVVFHQMQQKGLLADPVTYVCVLKACGTLVAINKGQEIHMEITKRGFADSDEAGNALIDMYCKCGYLLEADCVLLKSSRSGSLVLWNTLISGYVDYGHGEEALKCLDKLQAEGLHPDAGTYVSIIRACSNIAAVSKGMEIHGKITKEGLLEGDQLLSSSLLNMYAKCGMLEEAQEVFDGVLFRDAVSWTALIAGYVEYGQSEAALGCFKEMQREGISRDAITFVYVLKACASLGAINTGEEVHAEIFKAGGLLEMDMDVRNTLLDMYAKCGCPSKAKQMLDSFSRPDVVSWTTVVTAYGLVGDSKTTFSIVDRMMERGEKPNRVTFLTVLNLCSHTGLLDLAQLYLKSMCEDFDLVPGIEHHGCVVDLLGRAGRLEEAMFLAEKMPLQATSSGLWHALLNACRKCGDIALGKLAFENALLLDGADVAAYVGMSNLYGEC